MIPNKSTVVGIDEVGRGAWAGPLVAVAYLCENPVEGVKDSKLLSKAQREEIYPKLVSNGFWIESWISNKDIDARGVNWTNNEACKGAVEGLIALYRPQIDLNSLEVLVDGSKPIYGLPGIKQRSIIQGDRSVYEIGAASIIAKSGRDMWMESRQYSGRYGWGTNSGYGTKAHEETIKKYGLTELHRKSFIPKI